MILKDGMTIAVFKAPRWSKLKKDVYNVSTEREGKLLIFKNVLLPFSNLHLEPITENADELLASDDFEFEEIK